MPLSAHSLDLFRQQPLICDLGHADQAELAAVSLLQRFPEGVALFEQGSMPDLLYIVVEGLVASRASKNGARTTIRLAGVGAVFPLAPVLSGSLCNLSVETLTKTQVFMIPASIVQQFAKLRGAFAFAACLELAGRYKDLLDDLVSQKLDIAAQRLGLWLLHHQADQAEFMLPVNKGELAQLIGTTPENLARSMVTLSRHGVKVSGKSFHITNRAKLERFLGSGSDAD